MKVSFFFVVMYSTTLIGCQSNEPRKVLALGQTENINSNFTNLPDATTDTKPFNIVKENLARNYNATYYKSKANITHIKDSHYYQIS